MAAEWVARQGSGENVHQAMLSSGGRVNASNCRSLWEGVVGGVPATVDDVEDGPNGYLVRNSVMESFTQHNPVRHTTPDHARPRQTTPDHARPRQAMPHHATPCQATSPWPFRRAESSSRPFPRPPRMRLPTRRLLTRRVSTAADNDIDVLRTTAAAVPLGGRRGGSRDALPRLQPAGDHARRLHHSTVKVAVLARPDRATTGSSDCI